MSYERERMRHKLEKLRDELRANLDAENGLARSLHAVPTADELRRHYALYDLQMRPKPEEPAA